MKTLVKRTLSFSAMLWAAAASLQAAPITYSVSVDLSSINPGSSYSGSVTLPNALANGGSTPITLTANPGGLYLPGSLNETLSIGVGPSGFNSVFLSPVVFTNSSTSAQYNLIVNGAAHCDVIANPGGIPCQTTGQLIGGNANGGAAGYTVTIAPATIPEPSYGLPLLAAGALGIFVRRLYSN